MEKLKFSWSLEELFIGLSLKEVSKIQGANTYNSEYWIFRAQFTGTWRRGVCELEIRHWYNWLAVL